MNNLKLPITIDPFKSAQRRTQCEGFFDLSSFKRLHTVSQTKSGRISVNVTFMLDEQKLVSITGSGSTELTLICQRCNEPYNLPVSIEFSYSPIKRPEQVEELPSYYDAIELDDNGEVNLLELVEDELLLAIPLIPKHELKDCQESADSTWGKLPDELDKPNPFDVLKQLK